MTITADDALAPGLYPQFGSTENPLRYYPGVLASFVDLRGASGYIPQTYAVPDPANSTLAVDGWFEGLVSLPSESYLWAFSGWSSDEAAGFEIQVRDLRHGQKLFSRALRSHNLIVPGSPAIPFRLHLPPAPLLIIEPGLLSVQVHNLSAAAQTIQLVIHTVEPER